MFNDYKDCLFKNKAILKSQQRFKREAHKKPIRLHLAAIMIRDCKFLIKLQHIHMEQMLLKYVKVRCSVNINDKTLMIKRAKIN